MVVVVLLHVHLSQIFIHSRSINQHTPRGNERKGEKFPTGTIVKIFLCQPENFYCSSLIRSRSNSLLPPLRLNLSLRLWIYFFLSSVAAVPVRPAQTSRIMTLLTVKLPADMTGLIIFSLLFFMSHWHCYCCCGSQTATFTILSWL